jgi:parallel beta-helix repeat protein
MKIAQKLDRQLSLGQKHGNTLRQPANRQRFRSRQPISPIQNYSPRDRRAASGTTIQLAPGTYSAASGEQFPLEIPSGVKVIGNEANKGRGTLIQGSGKFVSPTAAGQNITILLATNSQLRGVTVTNLDSRGTGVWIESTSPTVANCTFTQCKREGVFATGTANPAILDNIFVENSAAGVITAGTAKE